MAPKKTKQNNTRQKRQQDPINVEEPEVSVSLNCVTQKGNMAQHTANIGTFASLINPFEGENNEGCLFFFKQFDSIAKLSNWSEENTVTILKSKLRGRAKEFLISDPTLMNSDSYDDLKQAFTQYFTDVYDVNSRQLQFSNICQREHETVKSLSHRIVLASNNYLGNTQSSEQNKEVKEILDKLRLSKFISALLPQLQQDVLKINPQSFTEAVKTATNLEIAQETFNKLKLNALVSQQALGGSSESGLEREVNQLRTELNNLRVANNGPVNTPNQRAMFCIGCGMENDHFFSDCYTFSRVQTATNRPQFNGFRNDRNNYNPRRPFRPNRGRGNRQNNPREENPQEPIQNPFLANRGNRQNNPREENTREPLQDHFLASRGTVGNTQPSA